jgi:branched-chain amino acid transport system ATP-binding protein
MTMDEPPPPALLDVRDLHAGYGPVQVLRGISFSMAAGSITALLGANGAGKTTLLRALCSMIDAQGEVRLCGERIDARSTEDIARLGVAHVPEDRGTFAALSTEENLLLGAHTRRDAAGVAQDIQRIYGYFPRLKERRSQAAGSLSGGEQQMLAISRALMLRPRLMLLDEPSFGLAPLVVRDIFAIMREIIRTRGVSILLVEQNAALALELADSALLIETGRLVFSGSAEGMRGNDAVRRAYMGC